MIRVGATLSPTNKNEVANLDLDFIEVKNLGLDFLEANADIICRFPMRSMHVQYLLSPDQRPTTLNLVSADTLELLKDESSPLYQAYKFLRPGVISFHLGFSSEETGTEGIDNHNYAIGRVLSRDETFERISASLLTISDRFKKMGYKGKILIENLDYHPSGAYEHICELDFISEMVEATGSLVLLDIGHTLISSARLNLNPFDFIREVGIRNICEVHANAPLNKNGTWYDLNEPFYSSTEAHNLLEFIVASKSQKAEPLLLCVEGDKEVERQLNLLRDKFGTPI